MTWLDYVGYGIFAAFCVFIIIGALLPIIGQPGKEGWEDIDE
jgi:hypothetical protein